MYVCISDYFAAFHRRYKETDRRTTGSMMTEELSLWVEKKALSNSEWHIPRRLVQQRRKCNSPPTKKNSKRPMSIIILVKNTQISRSLSRALHIHDPITRQDDIVVHRFRLMTVCFMIMTFSSTLTLFERRNLVTRANSVVVVLKCATVKMSR